MHLGAFRRERLTDLLTEAAAASGDENGFAFQRVVAKDIHAHDGAPLRHDGIEATSIVVLVNIFTNPPKAVKFSCEASEGGRLESKRGGVVSRARHRRFRR